MGNIIEYDANPQLEPSDRGIAAEEVVGRRIGEIGHQVGQAINEIGKRVQEHVDTMAMSSMYATGGQNESALRQSSDQFFTNPDNRALIQAGGGYAAVMQAVDQHLDESFQPPANVSDRVKLEWAKERARIRENISTRTLASQGEVSGAIWHENFGETVNQAGASVRDNYSPENVASQIKRVQDYLSTTAKAGLTPDEIAQAQRDILPGVSHVALAAYEGQLRDITHAYSVAAPGSADEKRAQALEEHARDRITAQENFQYIDPKEQPTQAAVDSAVEEGKRQFTAADNTANKQMEDQGRADYVSISDDIHNTIRAGGTPTPAQLKAISAWGAKYGSLRGMDGMFNTLESLADQTIADANSLKYQQDDPKTADGFYNRALSPANDPGALTQEEIDRAYTIDHSISTATHERLSQEIRDRDKPNSAQNQALKAVDAWAATAVRPQLTKSDPLDPNLSATTQGDVAWAEARREIHQIFAGWLKAGEDPAKIVDIMTNPANNRSIYQRIQYWKNAANSGDAVTYFQGHPQPNVAGEQVSPAPASIDRQPGESPEAYLKRTGG